jgi:hypothetical protein
MPKVVITPGQKVPTSGIYQKPGGDQVTLVKGEPAPPTPKKGQSFRLVEETKHKHSK